MIRLRDMPTAVHYTKTSKVDENGTFRQTKYVFYNLGIGTTDFVLGCNIQHYRGAGRVKVEYGDTLLGEFGWHRGMAYIVGNVTTTTPETYPGKFIRVTVEAYMDVDGYLLTVDLYLTCDENSPAPKPYHVARDTGTALIQDSDLITPAGMVTGSPTLLETTTTTTTTTSTTTTTTTTTPEPTDPVLFSTPEATVVPINPEEIVSPDPADYPNNPIDTPLSVSSLTVPDLADYVLTNYVYEAGKELFRFKIHGGSGIYRCEYTGLIPPLVIKSYASEADLSTESLEGFTFSTDSYKVVMLDGDSTIFTKEHIQDIAVSITVYDGTLVDDNDPNSAESQATATSSTISIIDSSDVLINEFVEETDTNNIIITGTDIDTLYAEQVLPLTQEQIFSYDLALGNTGISHNSFRSATWYMLQQPITYNAMLMKVHMSVEPASVKSWRFTFTPATALKDKLTFSPEPLLADDNVYLDPNPASWFNINKCFIVPRYKLVGSYFYWLFVFPEFTAPFYPEYLSAADPNNIVWPKAAKVYAFYKGGPFMFTKYKSPDPETGAHITSDNSALETDSPIFYVGTFKAEILDTDESTVLHTTNDIDFWYSCGNKLTTLPSSGRKHKLAIDLV